MIEVLLGLAIKTLVKEVIKTVAKVGAKAIKKAVTKAAGEAVKAGVKSATKKAVFSAIQKGLKDYKALASSIKTIVNTVSKPSAMKFLKGLEGLAKKEGLKDLSKAVQNVEKALKKPDVKSVVKDFLKQAKKDDKGLEDKDETDDIPFDSPEEAGEFKVDDKSKEKEEPDEFLDWYTIPREVRRQIDKDANKGSIYDSDLGDELIQNGFKGAHRSNIQRYIDDNMMMIDF